MAAESVSEPGEVGDPALFSYFSEQQYTTDKQVYRYSGEYVGKKNRHIRRQRLLCAAFTRSAGRSCCGGSGTVQTRLPGEVSDKNGEAGGGRGRGVLEAWGSRRSRRKRLFEPLQILRRRAEGGQLHFSVFHGKDR